MSRSNIRRTTTRYPIETVRLFIIQISHSLRLDKVVGLTIYVAKIVLILSVWFQRGTMNILFTWKKSYFLKSHMIEVDRCLQKSFIKQFKARSQQTITKETNLVLYPTATKPIIDRPTKFTTKSLSDIVKWSRVMNIRMRRIRPKKFKFISITARCFYSSVIFTVGISENFKWPEVRVVLESKQD